MIAVWHDLRLTVLDLETTSADPEDARIVTAAVGYVSGGLPTDLHTLVAAVEVDIPPEAVAIHGWTTERARREGRPTDEVLDIVLGHLDRRPDGGAVVVFNSPYDLTVLDRECQRHGIDAADLLASLLIVDPLCIDRHLDRYRRGSRKLDALCRHYRATLDSAHQAHSDALSAGRLAWRLGKQGRVVRRVRSEDERQELALLEREWALVRDDLPALHKAQARWYRDAAVELQEFFRAGNPAKGVPAQPDRHVPTEWPLIPVARRVAA